MTQRSFILGRAEVLTYAIIPPRRPHDKKYPYTLDEAISRLSSKFLAASAMLDALPQEACPNDYAVELLTLNPDFIAKSYFPETLLFEIGLHPLGSRNTIITPEKWTKKSDPQSVSTTELFVAGKRKVFRTIINQIESYPIDSSLADDFRKIETVSINQPIMKTTLDLPNKESMYFEIGLQLLGSSDTADIQTAFTAYASSLDIKVYNDLVFRAGNLLFIPVEGLLNNIKILANFTFIRVIRKMPTLRTLPHSALISRGLIKCPLPQEPAMAQDIRVAIMDGGLPPEHPIQPWLGSYRKMDETAEDDTASNRHGLGVTSAFLFGPLKEGCLPDRPYSLVTHLRILDKKIETEDPLLLYRTLGFVEEILLSREFQFLNLSLGPDLPIEEQDIHAWTAVIDDLLSDGNTFLTIAVGNNGELDRISGNARIQIPSDCVNGISVGSSDSQDNDWHRASYSAIGPGRSPGFIKPDLMAFGGTSSNYFHVLEPEISPTLSPTLGTSFASPFLLRTAVGIRAYLGDRLSILGIKALLVHTANRGDNNPVEVGWGKIDEDINSIISCPEGTARIIYQGELKPGKVIRAPIPLPSDITSGFITLSATFCYSSVTYPQNTDTYTRSGLDVCFRPNESKKVSNAKYPGTKSFFSHKPYETEEELRQDFGKWETVLHSEKRFQASSLLCPSFDIHYQIREHGMPVNSSALLKYALVITIFTPRYTDISSRILTSFPELQPINPRIVLPLNTR
jgi:hypothetical protein